MIVSNNNRMDTPFFSIIIPSFNSERTMRVLFESLRKQSFANFEAIVIDGVSNDNTLSILSEYQNKLENIRIISEKDEGIYDAMNKGIALAKGKWLYFIGCDDFLQDEEVLQKVYEIISTRLDSPDIVYGNVYTTAQQSGTVPIIYGGEYSKEMLAEKNICHQSMFFNRTLFARMGNYNINYKANADWDFNIKCFYSDNVKTCFIDEVIATWASGGFSTVYYDKLFKQAKPWLIGILSKKEVSFGYKITLIRRQFTWKLIDRKYRLAFAFLIKDAYKIF